MNTKFISLSAALCCLTLSGTALANSASGGIASAPIQPSTELISASQTTPSAKTETEQWVLDGWKHVVQNNMQAAVDTWQTAIDAMPAKRLLLFAGVYHPESAAIRQLKRLGTAHAGIMIQSMYQGEKAWYVLSAPAQGSVADARAALKNHLQVDRVWANDSQRFHSSKLAQAGENPARQQATALPARIPVIAPATEIAAVAVPVATPETLLMHAKTAAAQKQHSAALGFLAELLSRQPEHQSARLMYGRLLVLEEQYAEAFLVLSELLTADNQDWRPWYWMGSASLMLGQLKDASNYLSEAIAREGEHAALWVQRAIVEQEEGRHQTALQLLEIASSLDPMLAEVSLNIAYSADALGQRKLADKAYGRFLILTANSPQHIQLRQKILSSM